MVERPIKKSERQAMAESNNVGEESLETQNKTIEGAQNSTTQSQEERSITRPILEKDKSKGKGRNKGGQQKDDRSSKQPANLALMRGPKPTKPKPPVIQETQDETAQDAAATDQEEA